MARKLAFCLVSMLMVLTVAAASPVSAGTRSAAASACRPWKQQTSPNPGPANNLDDTFFGVAALSASNAWAVGYYGPGGSSMTLIEHWNGHSWKVVPSPSPGTGGELKGVYAVSATNIWAAGFYSGGTLIEHWNGAAWSVVPTPSTGSGLSAIRGTSARDIWAVGYIGITEGETRTLILHWGGSHWRVVPSASVGTQENFLQAVRPLSPTDAWAVGYYVHINAGRTLILHWNGSHWRIVASPNVGSIDDLLEGVRATSPTDAWAVGRYDSIGAVENALILHWNGSHWRVSASPSVHGELYAIAGASPTNAYAVGQASTATGSNTLIVHWDGSHWRTVPGANLATGDNVFNGAFALSPTNIWAVGSYGNGGGGLTLAEHCG